MSPRKRKPKRQRKPARRDDAYLLDRFSEKDLRQWKRQAELLREYRVKEYYYLEGLRAVHKEEIARALTSSPPPPLRVKGWTRIVDYKYSHEPLSAIGSLHVSGRFNVGRDVDPEAFPVFSALYVAEDYDTAYAEKFSAGRQWPKNLFLADDEKDALKCASKECCTTRSISGTLELFAPSPASSGSSSSPAS